MFQANFYQQKNNLIDLTLFINLIITSYCYRGVYRLNSGIDVELYDLKNDNCEKTSLGSERYDPPGLAEYCGYACATSSQRGTSSVYKISSNAFSPGCAYDNDILSDEACDAGFEHSWNKTKINSLTAEEIDKQFILVNQTQASRCQLKDDLSVKYRNTTTGWREFLYSDCFKFDVFDDNNEAKARIIISCISLHKRYLDGHFFKINLLCHIDAEMRSYETCLMFKVPGLFIENVNKSVLSTKDVYTSPTPSVATTQVSQTDDGSDGFMNPNGYIIIAVIFFIIIVILIIVLCIYCRRKKDYNVDDKTQKAIDNTTHGVFPVLNVNLNENTSNAKDWLQLNEAESNMDTTPTAERKEINNEGVSVSEFVSMRSYGLENPLFQIDQNNVSETNSLVNKESKPLDSDLAVANFTFPFESRNKLLTPPLLLLHTESNGLKKSTSSVSVEYAKVNKGDIVKENLNQTDDEPVYEELPEDKEKDKENITKSPDILNKNKANCSNNVEFLSVKKDMNQPSEKSISDPYAEFDKTSLLSNQNVVDTVVVTSASKIAKMGDNKDSLENQVHLHEIESSTNTTSDESLENIDLPDYLRDRITYWKSKALKRTSSKSETLIQQRTGSSNDSNTSCEEINSEDISKSTDIIPKMKKKPEKPKRTKTSIRSNGTLLKLPFDNYKDENGHIYCNNNAVVVTEPLSKYVHPGDDGVLCDISDSDDNEDNESSTYSKSSEDTISTIENKYKVPLPVQNHNTCDTYAVPLPTSPTVFDFDLKQTHCNTVNHPYYHPPEFDFSLWKNDNQPVYDQPPISNYNAPLPQLLKKERNYSNEEAYNAIPWPPVTTYSDDPTNDFYDVVPKIKSDRKEDLTINFRCPVPSEIKLTRLAYSQFNYGDRNASDENSSCNGFCLAVANLFLTDESFVIANLMEQIPELLKESESIWNELSVGNTTVDEAYKILKNVYNTEFECCLGEERFWSIDQGVGGNSPFEALDDLYYSCVNSPKKECLVLTFHPDKSCVCLFDENGTQYFIDVHVHFKTNNQDRTEALDDCDCGGVIARTTINKSDVMLNFILTNMCLEMKADSKNGTAFPIYKNSMLWMSKEYHNAATKVQTSSTNSDEDFLESYNKRSATLNHNVFFVQSNFNPGFQLEKIGEGIENETNAKEFSLCNNDKKSNLNQEENTYEENPYEDPDELMDKVTRSRELAGCNKNPTNQSKKTNNSNEVVMPQEVPKRNKILISDKFSTASSTKSNDSAFWNKSSNEDILKRQNNSLLKDEVLLQLGLDGSGNVLSHKDNTNINVHSDPRDAYKVTDLLENHPHLDHLKINERKIFGRKSSKKIINFHQDDAMF